MAEDRDGSTVGDSRLRAVGRVLRQWRSQLIDVSGANRLLYYRDLKVAVVDLEDLTAGARAELLSGRDVRPGRLWPDTARLAGAVRSLKAIAKPARVYAEEFGLQITYIASGFAAWTVDSGREPCAPVLLRQLSFRALPGSLDAFELQAAEDVQVNPVLLHLLEAEHGIVIDDSDLLEGASDSEAVLYERLIKVCRTDLPGFAIEPRSVIANFAYASQAMVADLGDENVEFLAAHDMVAALAGDAGATDLVRTQGNEVRLDEPDICPPSTEHLILDADGSQSYVINAVVGGQHLVIQGPPGTGKTQTITNVVADLVARGKTVLFVAQKRAAITAVLDRLKAAQLDGLVLDLFDGSSSRKTIVHELGTAIERASTTTRPRVEALHEAYAGARDLLVAHRAAMHEVRAPWDLSLLGSKDSMTGECFDSFYDWAILTRADGSAVRLDVAALRSWDAGTHDRLRGNLEELFAAGGLDRSFLERPGWAVIALATLDVLDRAEEVVRDLADRLLPAAIADLQVLAADVGVEQETLSVTWADGLLAVLGRIEALHDRDLGPLVQPAFLSDDVLRQMLAATGDKGYRRTHASNAGMLERRKLRKQLSALVPSLAAPDAHKVLHDAAAVRAEWARMTGAEVPDPKPSWQVAATSVMNLQQGIADLCPSIQGLDLDRLHTLGGTLDALRRDRQRRALPRIHALRAGLSAAGCGAVLEDLAIAPADSGVAAANRLSHAFASSVIEHLDQSDPRLAGYKADDLNRATETLMTADERLREANVSRVRRAAAERLVTALDAYPEQAEALRGQVKRKRGFQPVRRLVDKLAPDVILAAKPVWAASPQVVSQLLPSRVLFDVVLFDEASQVLPAAALPSIARGRQVVVAGDDLQLPPTTLFTRTAELEVDDSMDLDTIEPEEEDDEAAGEANLSPSPARWAEIPDTESILDAIGVKLGTQRSRYLAWHYRSRDEKLIATSNTFLYRPRGRMMTTFPAADSAGALVLDQCPPSTGLGKTNLSPTGEVERVVDLMFSHARDQVEEDSPLSLGVIAFGAKHAARIEREFEERMADAPAEIQAFFGPEAPEPYFIKNIERVQGDERDVILLTIGYSKGIDGRLRYNWGPVLTEGGHRRVNVAITRARHRMRLVTSFGVADIDQNASTAEGFGLMYRFIRYAASEGTDFGDEGTTNIPCNVFEADILGRLEARGLIVVPQWGVGGYRLDFAIRHPDEPGRFVLAVEADGASYHSGLVARERDRLRQRQLEARGWRFVRIWSSDYFFDPDPEIDRVVRAYEEQLGRSTPPRVGREPVTAVGGPASQVRQASRRVVVPAWDDPEPSRRPRPQIVARQPIQRYSDEDLRVMVRWVGSDDLPRTRTDLYEAVKSELGFQRNGANIVQRINEAIDAVLGERSRRLGPSGAL